MLSYCLQGVSFVSHSEKVILVHCLDAIASDWNLQDSQTLGLPCVFGAFLHPSPASTPIIPCCVRSPVAHTSLKYTHLWSLKLSTAQ